MVNLILSTLQSIRNGNPFWEYYQITALVNIAAPTLPCKRKTPERYKMNEINTRITTEAVADPEIKQRGPSAVRRHSGNCAHAHKMYTRSRGGANGETDTH